MAVCGRDRDYYIRCGSMAVAFRPIGHNDFVELNKRCGTNWIWTVVSQARLNEEGNDITDVAFWHISTEEEYSNDAVADAVSDWLSRHGYDLDVEVTSIEEAEGSGILKELEEFSEKDFESEQYVPLKDWSEDRGKIQTKRVEHSAKGSKY